MYVNFLLVVLIPF